MTEWSIDTQPNVPRQACAKYIATAVIDGQHTLVRVTMAWPPDQLHVSGLRLRIREVEDPEASAWAAIADHIERLLADATTREKTHHDRQ